MIDTQMIGYTILAGFGVSSLFIVIILLFHKANKSHTNNLTVVEQTLLANKQCADCIHCIYNIIGTDCDATGYATSLGRQACRRFEKGGARHGYYHHL